MDHDLDFAGNCRSCGASRMMFDDHLVDDICPGRAAITIFDFGIGERRPAKQEDINLMEDFLASLSELVRPNPVPAIDASQDYDFQLAVFQNPMRQDSVFVAENKDIKPYEGFTNLDGKPCYPATPETEFKIGIGIAPGFAAEIVRRWNAYKPS